MKCVGLVAAESVLDTRDPALARIWDQAALLQFFLGRFREAERNCLKSLEAAKSLEQEEGRGIAVAMCQLRLGTIYLGLHLICNHEIGEYVLTTIIVYP